MTRARTGLIGLLVGVIVGARAWRRRPVSGPADDRAELGAVAREDHRAQRALRTELAAVEHRGRRRAALTVALVAVAALPAVGLAARPDAEPLAAALLIGAYALLAVVALAIASRPPPRA